MRRMRRSAIALFLAVLLAFQGTEPLFVQAKEAIENAPRDVDLSRPDALTEEEAGIADSTAQEEEAQEVEETLSEKEEENAEQQSEGQEEVTQDAPEEVEVKEPEDYYPLPEEPDGELVDYDEISRTYKTGEKEYTTIFGGYVGTYEDEDGETQLVDNTLEQPEEKPQKKSAKTRSAFAEANSSPAQEVYQNKANDYVIQLPKNITEGAGILVEKGDYHVEIIPVQGDYSHSVVKDNAIRYNQVYDGIDVQYTVLDNNIKEDIILQKPVEQSVFEYELNIPGLKAEMKDNQVYLYPEDKTMEDAEYILEAPSMEDAAGAMDFNIALELREENEKTILSVKPDQEWLASEERQYPIRIDPSTVNISRESFSMIGVEQGSPTSNIGDNNYPYVGYDDGIKSGNLAGFGTAHMICRTYIKVNSDFSVIPKDSKIDSATFSVSQRTAYSGGASQFGLYRVDDSWNNGITWKAQPYNHTFIDVQNASASRNAYIHYNVKDLVNDWVQGTYANIPQDREILRRAPFCDGRGRIRNEAGL